MHLTKTIVDKLSYAKADNAADYRWDDKLRGFGLRIYPSGRRAFVIVYRNATGTKRFLTLGDYGSLTLDAAREMAKDKLGEVRKGADPQADKQEKRREITFNELADRYLEHFEHHKRSCHDDKQRLRDHLRPVLGHRKVTEITLRQLEQLHTSIKEARSPATANRCAAVVKHLFNTGIKWGLLESSPAKSLSMFREPPGRDIMLSPAECARLLEACDADENKFAAALFKLAMFTGRRIGELLAAKWEDANLDSAVLTLPMTKAGERQFVYLNDAALAVLIALPRIAGNPYIIAGAAEGKALNFYRRPWMRILKRAELAPFPPHGLRHSYASILVAAGVPLETVGHLLGHKNSVTTRRYAHHRPDQLRRASEMFSNVIAFPSSKHETTQPSLKRNSGAQ
jgi:integrase